MINTIRTIKGDLPRLTMSDEQIRSLMISLFAKSSGSHYFTSFITSFSAVLTKDNTGFNAEPYTTYYGDISVFDQIRVREIIWDWIIERHLTVGAGANHEWPSFSVTDRGKAYFASVDQTRS